MILAVLSISTIHASESDDLRSKREAAVITARNGNAAAGLDALLALVKLNPEDPRLLADTTIVANWAGRDQLVLDLYARPLTPKDDAGVVEAAARSARNLHLYDQSVDLYRHAEALDPTRWQPQLGEAMALTDKGDYAPAAVLMRPLLLRHKNETDVLLGEAYLCGRLGDFTCSVSMDELYLDKSPSSSELRSELALSLSKSGSQTLAATYYAAEVTPIVPEIENSLNSAAAGEQVGWGEAFALTRAQQRTESMEALVRLHGVIEASTSNQVIWRFAQFDRIVALYDLREMHSVVELYESLTRQGFDVPEYALKDVAAAYLSLRHPEIAEALYHKLVAQDPVDGRLRGSLAYAQLENEHTYEALATIDKAYKEAPPWLKPTGLGTLTPNRVRIELESQAAQMRGDVGLLAEGQRWLDYLVKAAPGDAQIRWELAASDLSRGWPQRALLESRIAADYTPPDELPSLTSAEIYEGADLRDKVDAMMPALRIRDFDSPALKRFLSSEHIERGWQFDAETVFGWGSGVEVGSDDQHSEAHLDSPLLDNRWRIYLHELGDSGTFVIGSAERTREGAGVHYDYDRQEAWAEFAHDTGTNRNAGNIGTKLSLGDFWTLRAEADSDSFDVPVRALTGKVHGRSVDMNLGWRGSELVDADAGLQRVLFSDGNQRTAISGAWNERVWTTPRLQATVSAEEWTSSNSLNENRPYFNPQKDFSLGPRGALDWLTWRRYDRSFHQEVDFYVAPYWQQNYGTGASVAVHYAQRWKMRPGLDWHVGVTWNSQPYDGSSEHATSLESGITWGHP